MLSDIKDNATTLRQFTRSSRRISTHTEGVKSRINNAGDFVSIAPPKKKPAIMAKSKRRVFTNNTIKKQDQILNIARIESTKAILSKNKAYGQIAQIRADTLAANFDLKSR